MSGGINWKALQSCVVNGAYHDAGEVFEAPDGDYDPAVRVKLDDAGEPQTAKAKQEKPLDKMDAAELEAIAKTLGFEFPAEVKTNKDKAKYLAEKQAAVEAAGVMPSDLPPEQY